MIVTGKVRKAYTIITESEASAMDIVQPFC